MKKITALILASVLVLTLVGCAQSKPAAGDSEIDLYEEYIPSVIYENMDEYLTALRESDEFAEVVETTKNAGMNLSLQSRGNDFVYVYIYTVEIQDNAKTLITEAFKSTEEEFQYAANSIRKEAPFVEKVIWEYWTGSGELVVSFEK